MGQLDDLGRKGSSSPVQGSSSQERVGVEGDPDDLKSGLLDVKMQAMEWVRKRQQQRDDFYEQNAGLNSTSQRMRSSRECISRSGN